MSKIIAIAVPKGGVGKTTTAVNLATSLAVAEKRTLLVDVDPMGTCSDALGITKNSISGGIFEVFSFTKSLDQVIHHTGIMNLDFIPSKLYSFINEERLTRLAENKLILRNVLRDQIYNYDYIIIDCPPYLRGLTTCALLAADSVILPFKAESFSLGAVTKLLEHIEWIKKQGNSLLRIEGILLTMYEARTKVSMMAEKQLYENHEPLVFKTIIPKNIKITEATYNGKPVIFYDALAKGAIAYLKLAHELIQREI